MSKGDCMAAVPAALSNSLLLHAHAMEPDEEMPANNDRENTRRGLGNFLRMLRAFFIPARSVATQAG